MFVSVRSTGAEAWASQSSPENQQPSNRQTSDALPRQGPDRPGGVPTHVPLPVSYACEPSGTVHTDSVNPAIKIDEKGRRHISDGTHTFAIRYDRDNRTERVYQPKNPTKPGIPVRLNRRGDYECHDEVGLKGGAGGRELQARLDRARGALDQAIADRQRAINDRARAYGEIRRSQNPGMDLEMRKQQAQRDLDQAKMAIAIEEGRIEAVRREAQLLRQGMQADLTQLRGHREEGTQLERGTQQEIAALDSAMRVTDQPSAESQQKLQKLQDDLRRIQQANGTLDQRIMNLHWLMDEIPQG